MNALTVLAHRRPVYLRETLSAVARCDGISEWRVVVVMDRPDQLTRDCVARFAPIGSECVELNLGNVDDPPYWRISRATLLTLALGFATAEYVVHLEEDCVPSPDLLTWHAVMADRYRDDPAVFTVNAWSGPVGQVHEQGDHVAPFLTPWAFGTWRDRFDEMRAGWDLHYWDRHLNERMRGMRLGVFPASSKVRNIGRIGTQPAEEWDARERVAS